jgi:acyl-CoA synthetase (AMP-forming)/AMP-acid ligase II
VGHAGTAPALSGAGERLSYAALGARVEALAATLADDGGLGGAPVPGAVGTPLPGVEVDVVTDDGAPAAVGEPGELRVRSTQMFSGYHGDAAATAASFDERGRFRTGDTGTRDAAGVIPRALRLVPALPRNAMGKVKKKHLLEEPR